MKRIILWAALALAAGQAAGQQGQVAQREWTVNDTLRKALVYVPDGATRQPTPVLFAFHGRGGKMDRFMNLTQFHVLWPEAIVVYPQGLPWVGGIVGNGKPLDGWIMTPGDGGGRDIRFFDAMLATLEKEYRIDPKRIYSTGHSNGGGFTYALWALRGDVLAAVAPCAAAGRGQGRDNLVRQLTPKPAMVVAGEQDALVPFELQTEMIGALRQLNGATGAGVEGAQYVTVYDSPSGNPVETYIHPGGHALPPKALPYVVEFLKKHPKVPTGTRINLR